MRNETTESYLPIGFKIRLKEVPGHFAFGTKIKSKPTANFFIEQMPIRGLSLLWILVPNIDGANGRVDP